MLVELSDQSQSVACIYCEGPVSVPSRAMALEMLERERLRPAPPVEAYELASPESEDKPRGAGKAARQKARVEKAKSAETVVMCPTCQERMRVVAGDKPGQIHCTFCGTAVPVPARDMLVSWKPAPIRSGKGKEVGSYTASAPLPVAPIRTHLFDRMAEIRSEKPIPPPKWTFFSRVFQFPWTAGAVIRWGWMSVGFTILALIVGGLFLTAEAAVAGAGGVGNFGIVGLGFLMLPLIWISLLTLSYSSDCFLRVLESTAYGHDQVEAWPEGGWKEWMPNLLYLGWIGALPTVLSYGIARLAGLQDIPFWPTMLGSIFFLYPIALMSALEANSVWVPLTIPVIKSLVSVGWAWAVFFLLTGLLGVAICAVAYFGFRFVGFGTWIGLGLIIPMALLIYARLMGRLAWKIGRTVTS